MADPRFKYEDYERTVFITREELNLIIQDLLRTKSSWKDIIFTLAKIGGLMWAMKIRKDMHEEELTFERQMYTQRREDDLEDRRSKPDLDGRPRDEP